MVYREIIALYAQIHTKHINKLCGQNAELLNVKLGGTYNDHWTFRRLNELRITTEYLIVCSPL
jgi:hypothetical protein